MRTFIGGETKELRSGRRPQFCAKRGNPLGQSRDTTDALLLGRVTGKRKKKRVNNTLTRKDCTRGERHSFLNPRGLR